MNQLLDVRIELPYATFGITIDDGLVIEAPPIARWAIGRTWSSVAQHYRRHKAAFTFTLHTGKEPQP